MKTLRKTLYPISKLNNFFWQIWATVQYVISTEQKNFVCNKTLSNTKTHYLRVYPSLNSDTLIHIWITSGNIVKFCKSQWKFNVTKKKYSRVGLFRISWLRLCIYLCLVSFSLLRFRFLVCHTTRCVTSQKTAAVFWIPKTAVKETTFHCALL